MVGHDRESVHVIHKRLLDIKSLRQLTLRIMQQ